MKKLTKVTALMLSAVMLCALLASCSLPFLGTILNGTYTNINGEITEGPESTGVVYEFKGNKVTVTNYAFGRVINQYSGTYSIKDGKITFVSDELFLGAVHDQSINKYTRTLDFEQGDGYIVVGGTSCDKK